MHAQAILRVSFGMRKIAGFQIFCAPTVANTQTCRLLVATQQIGTGGTPESWQIVGVSYSGPCVGMY